MPLSRRQTLALVGGGVVLAASASAGTFLATRTPTRALEPWDAAGTYAEPRMRALSYAILAPNPHNLQPWIADLRTPHTVILTADPARVLPDTDPYRRQITAGLGCFLELMRIAASLDGIDVTWQLYPDGTASDAPISVARFAPGGTPDPLGAYILERRSLKRPMDMTRAIPDAALGELLASPAGLARIGAATAPDEVAPIRDLTLAAWLVEVSTPAPRDESIRLTRFGKAEIEANPDGISLGGPLLESLMVAGMLTRASAADPDSAGFNAALDSVNATLTATPAHVWLATPSNARTDQIAAGRAWLRLNLAATGLGLGLHPVSQCLQEYPEMAALYAEAHARLGEPGETVQMLGRLGYGPRTPRTPRWPLETRVVDA